MRNERSEPKKTKHTKVLFKKSDLTVARSSIFSDASQRYTKSAIRRIKRELQRDDYYTYKGKLKRDLSLETDNCILRRYCKKKLTSLASSAKTKYSNFYAADNETIEEFEDSSGSGDNKKSALDNDNSFNADVTILMMENLKHHLNVWVEKHLTDDKDIKRKFNNVLDSILYRLYMEDANNYSHTNYSLERDNKIPQGKAGTSSGICQICKKRRKPKSCPKLKKALKSNSYHISKKHNQSGFLSSLSVPKISSVGKTFTMDGSHQKSKNLEMESTITEEQFTMTPDEVLACSKSSIQNCLFFTTDSITQNNVHILKIIPKLFHKSSSGPRRKTSTRTKNKLKNNFEALPSLVRTMYITDPANVTSTDANFLVHSTKEVFTMTEPKISKGFVMSGSKNIKIKMQSQTVVTTLSAQSNTTILRDIADPISDSFDKKPESQKSIDEKTPKNIIKSDISIVTTTVNNKVSIHKNQKVSSNTKNCLKSTARNKSIKHSANPGNCKRKRKNFQKLYSSRFSRKHSTRTFSKTPFEKELMGYVEKISQYFFNSNECKNIKFDVNINISPFMDIQTNDKNTDNNENDGKETVIKENKKDSLLNNEHGICSPPSLLVFHNNTTKTFPTIIPLLDGAASKAKYIFESKNSTTGNSITSCYNSKIEHDTVTSRDIIELKEIVKNISQTAENLVYEHMKRKLESCKNSLSYTNIDSIQTAPNESRTKIESIVLPTNSITNKEEESKSTPTAYLTKDVSKSSIDPNLVKVVHKLQNVINLELTPSYPKIDDIIHESSKSNIKKKISVEPSNRKVLPCLPDLSVKVKTESKEVQTSAPKVPVTGFSGLKLIKEPKRTDSPKKSLKKSASYNIIESESILRVTDMTVGEANVESKVKSKSLLNIEMKNEMPKIITFYCDRCSKKCELLYKKDNSGKNVTIVKHKTSKIALKDAEFCGDYDRHDDGNVDDIEKATPSNDSAKPKSSCHRNAFHFTLVLVIAVIVVSIVYFYVFNDKFKSFLMSKTTRKQNNHAQIPLKENYFLSFHYTKQTKPPGLRWFSSELGF